MATLRMSHRLFPPPIESGTRLGGQISVPKIPCSARLIVIKNDHPNHFFIVRILKEFDYSDRKVCHGTSTITRFLFEKTLCGLFKFKG
jgi:hypothetical protein